MLMIIINKQGKHTTVLYARSRQILFPFALCVLFFFRFFVPYFFLCFFVVVLFSRLFVVFILIFVLFIVILWLYCVWTFSHGILTFFDCTEKKGDTKTSKINTKKKYQQTNRNRLWNFASVVNGVVRLQITYVHLSIGYGFFTSFFFSRTSNWKINRNRMISNRKLHCMIGHRESILGMQIVWSDSHWTRGSEYFGVHFKLSSINRYIKSRIGNSF